MKKKGVPIFLSAVDEERFGIRTAKAGKIELDDISAIMEYCKKNKVRLLLARCCASEMKAVQELERMVEEGVTPWRRPGSTRKI